MGYCSPGTNVSGGEVQEPVNVTLSVKDVILIVQVEIFDGLAESKEILLGKALLGKSDFCVMFCRPPEEMIVNYLKHHFEKNSNDIFKTKYG